MTNALRSRAPLIATFAVTLLCGCSRVKEQIANLIHPAPPAPVRTLSAPTAEKSNAFMGHYGYMLTYPSDYTATPSWGDAQKTLEVVYFHPRENPPQSSDDPRLVRLEVSPLKEPNGHVSSLDEYKRGMANTFKKYGETGAFGNATANIPGFTVVITHSTKPGALFQVVLQGKLVLYMFTAHDQKLAESLAASLVEVAPHGHPGQ